MQRRLTAVVATLVFASIACSGKNGPGISAAEEITSAPTEPPSESRTDGGTFDASAVDAATDSGHDAGASACERCLAAPDPFGCKTERDACMMHATCKLLDSCLDACTTTTCRNGCFTKYPDAEARARNGALYKCQCTTTCVIECSVECH